MRYKKIEVLNGKCTLNDGWPHVLLKLISDNSRQFPSVLDRIRAVNGTNDGKLTPMYFTLIKVNGLWVQKHPTVFRGETSIHQTSNASFKKADNQEIHHNIYNKTNHGPSPATVFTYRPQAYYVSSSANPVYTKSLDILAHFFPKTFVGLKTYDPSIEETYNKLYSILGDKLTREQYAELIECKQYSQFNSLLTLEKMREFDEKDNFKGDDL